MTAPTHDDNFHEIQLNGKQLVFLFMAATVVSVVIFLSGVMVGRGVRSERLAAAAATEALDEPTADAVTAPPADPPPAAIDLTKTEAPPTASETIAPPSGKATDESEEIRPDRPRLKEPAPLPTKPAQVVASSSSTAARTAPVAPKSAPIKESAPQAVAEPANTSKAAADANAGEPGGYAVQVAALDTRSEADAIAKRLSTKGYTAYVQAPAGTTSVYRVRVGMFKTRREADSIATKLQKEEHVKPWVTR